MKAAKKLFINTKITLAKIRKGDLSLMIFYFMVTPEFEISISTPSIAAMEERSFF